MSGDRCADCVALRAELEAARASDATGVQAIQRLRAEVEALRGEREEARAWRKDAEAVHEELAAVLKGKDALGGRLCEALGLPPSPLTRAVDEAVARLAAAQKRIEGLVEAFERCIRVVESIRDEGRHWSNFDAGDYALALRSAPPGDT